MNAHKHYHQNREGVQEDQGPYWKRAHRDWRVWAAVVLMFAAILIYVVSDDFALQPTGQPRHLRSGVIAP